MQIVSSTISRWSVTKFKRIILITGTPGVGKTAVASLLVSKMDAIHIDIAELVKKENLISGFDKARGTLIADTDRVSKRVRKIVEDSKKDAIVDGHYAVDVVPSIDTHIVLVLRRDPDELKKLLEDYGFEERKLWENLAAEILDVCLWNAISTCGSNKVCEIDTSERDVEEVVDEIMSILEAKRKCDTGIVDWLGKLEKEGRLQDFLKHF